MNVDLTGKRHWSPAARAASARRSRAGCTAAGANVLVHYRDSDADAAKLVAELNGVRPKSAATVKAELLAPIAPRALVSAALERFGRLDLLVNNASAFFPVAARRDRGSRTGRSWSARTCARRFSSRRRRPPQLAKQRRRDRQHRRHPRRAAARRAIPSTASPRRAGGADALARARARAARCASTASRPAPSPGPRTASSTAAERERVIATTPLGRTRHAGRHRAGSTLPRLRALRHRPDPGGGWRPLDLHMNAAFIKPREIYEAGKLAKRLRRQVGEAIADFNMIEEGDKVMVCLSGGKDSHALLDVLLALQEKSPGRVRARSRSTSTRSSRASRRTCCPSTSTSRGVPFRIVEQDTYSRREARDPRGQDDVLAVLAPAARRALPRRGRARRHQDRARPPPRRHPRDLLPQPLPRRQAEGDAAEAASPTTASTS